MPKPSCNCDPNRIGAVQTEVCCAGCAAGQGCNAVGAKPKMKFMSARERQNRLWRRKLFLQQAIAFASE